MKLLAATLLFILSLPLQCSCAVSSIGCDATEPVARKALDLINKGRWDGYLFQLLRVADAHLDQAEFGAVYYLVLDVKESDCSVLSRKHWDDCEPALSRRPSDTVIGQCKVIATTRLLGSPNLRVKDFNCTTSSVSSALTNTKDSPVLLDFFEDTELYRKQADKALEKYKRENGDFASFKVDKVKRVIRARGGERMGYYLDFSVRNCSSHTFPRHSRVFGFCRADLFYDVEDSNLETLKDIVINCEVFNLEEHRNISDVTHRLGHRLHSGEHEHSPAGRPPFKPDGSRDHHHPQHSHNFRCPPPLEDKSHLNSPTLQAGAPPPLPPPGSKGLHPCSITKGARGPPNNHIAGEHHPHTHHLHRQHPHGHHPHGHHPQGHHPHDHDFYHHGPCDPPPHSQGPQDHHRRGHGPPPRHSEEGGPSKGHFPFHWWQIGYVHRLPPLKKDEALPLPEANFPRISLPHPHNPLLLEIQAFPQSKSESCPGAFNSKFPHITKFFANAVPK
ncbi:histidine-rich glycoprotein [Hippopotamus amphibius kiboko]|uniref:histidine-rich glycoprotein n=1 Tax=Hippopotamus amphibius kiboko TaxID=575201 RepID=UPI002596CCB5|nr:histidine-rich glycoprotein [Hippopotamus amphibius kiboko]